MQPNADLARTLCATTGDSAEYRHTEVVGVAACRETGKWMSGRNEMGVRNWTVAGYAIGYFSKKEYHSINGFHFIYFQLEKLIL